MPQIQWWVVFNQANINLFFCHVFIVFYSLSECTDLLSARVVDLFLANIFRLSSVLFAIFLIKFREQIQVAVLLCHKSPMQSRFGSLNLDRASWTSLF